MSLVHRRPSWFAKRLPFILTSIQLTSTVRGRSVGKGCRAGKTRPGSRVIGADSGVSRAGKTFREHGAAMEEPPASSSDRIPSEDPLG